MANYCLVSSITFLGKVIERAVRDQFYLDNSPAQPFSGWAMGYRLLALVENCCLSVDKGQASLLLLLDLSAAFDTTDHAIVLRSLEAEVGIRGCVQLVKSFLTDQTQRVAIGNQVR